MKTSIETLTAMSDVPRLYMHVTKNDLPESLKRFKQKQELVQRLIDFPILAISGKQKSKVAAIILRETFAINPLRVYSFRAWYTDAYTVLQEARKDQERFDQLIFIRTLVLTNVDQIESNCRLIFGAVLRQRLAADRLTIITCDDPAFNSAEYGIPSEVQDLINNGGIAA